MTSLLNPSVLKELFETIEARKKIEKQEAALKDQVKEYMASASTNAINSDGFVITLSDRNRTDLNKDALKEHLGLDYAKFEVTKTYQVMDVKKVL